MAKCFIDNTTSSVKICACCQTNHAQNTRARHLAPAARHRGSSKAHLIAERPRRVTGVIAGYLSRQRLSWHVVSVKTNSRQCSQFPALREPDRKMGSPHSERETGTWTRSTGETLDLVSGQRPVTALGHSPGPHFPADHCGLL